MHISEKTNIHDLLEQYPYLEDFLGRRNSLYKNLKNPLMRNTIGRIASLEKVASRSGENVTELVEALEKEISLKGREGFKTFVGKKYVDPDKKTRLKDIIIALHEGEDPEKLKQQFADLVKGVTTTEIADLEQSLIDDGLPKREIRRLCDLHVAIFQESLDESKVPELAKGHPIHTFMLENRAAENISSRLKDLLGGLGNPPEISRIEESADQFKSLLTDLATINIHYTRKENQLFPLLEKNNVTGPTQIMWTIHDDIRGLLKGAKDDLRKNKLSTLPATVKDIIGQVAGMIYKEEHILFPMALDVLSEDDWQRVRHGEEAIGYAWIDPPPKTRATEERTNPARAASTGELVMQTGVLSLEQVNLLLTHLPVDISFVDENDKVAYYSDCPARVFPRSPAVIGRAVQNCHPAESVETVNTILNSFRKGEQRTAEFWITLGNTFLHIRYIAVYDQQGSYRGCLEVAQDVTTIRQLSGEKRLLDWE